MSVHVHAIRNSDAPALTGEVEENVAHAGTVPFLHCTGWCEWLESKILALRRNRDDQSSNVSLV